MDLKKIMSLFLAFSLPFIASCKPIEITPKQASKKVNEILESHATYKTLTPELVKRILTNYLEELDPLKTYFIASDIKQFTDPTDSQLNAIMLQLQAGDYSVFENIQNGLVKVIDRHRQLEKQVDMANLPSHVKQEEFKDMKWVDNESELLVRLERIKALQVETAAKLSDADKEKTFQRIAKRKAHFEEEMQEKDPEIKQRQILTDMLKATASALDSHSSYFTPEEASQFMIHVQQRLFGIGAQLRDDVNGFTIVKVIEGGPAAKNKDIKVKDRIIAVNGEPVVGLDIVDAVDLIRGEENTPVVLTLVREVNENGIEKEETHIVTVIRGEVVLKETRYEAATEPFGDGSIGYIRLFSFYQDPDSSSGSDLSKVIEEMKHSDKPLKGLILDLRYNLGGLLPQAVAVAGLFISKGIVVSIKDETGAIQHLRHLDEDVVWDGPLVVLVNRASASASEIVAGTLKDYGRALVIGDDHTFGKGSFQTFTLNATKNEHINPQGEYKVTRGRYYPVSGVSPQLTGVESQIVAPGVLSETEIGEKFGKYPLSSDSIPANFDDDLSDVPASQRNSIRLLYKFNLQPKLDTYVPYLPALKENSQLRIQNNKNYQAFIKELKDKKEDTKDVEPDEEGADLKVSKTDFQLIEANNVLKDYLYMMLQKKQTMAPQQPEATSQMK